MTTMIRRKRVDSTNGAVVPACGLPAWAVVVIDGLLSSSVIRAEVIDHLGPEELCAVARDAMRRAFADYTLDAVEGE